MAEEIKERILEFLDNAEDSEEFTVTSLAKNLNFSYSSVLKWVDVLFAEGRILVKDYGNVKVIKKKNDTTTKEKD